ncbi:MAG: hypothetical protein EXR07_19480 [Acetobacteraceae bacterium]|nr:hypothetical protein [Acetobacteraceae bacterium]
MIRFLVVTLLLVLGQAACAQDGDVNPRLIPPAPLHERVVRLPGDPDRPVTLEVTIYTPPGSGPFPLAVLNHGATNAGAGNRGTRYRYTYNAYYFLSRGYAVALPMARGFSRSGGEIVHDGCHLDNIGRLNALDLKAVIAALGQEIPLDRTRIVVAGQSFGGWTTMALGTIEVPGVRGLIGFAPALRASNCAWQDQAMISAARGFGQGARYPSLWIYGDNDTVMPTATWRAVHAAYASGTKGAELAAVGPFLEDSHQILGFPEGLPVWTPKADAFLAKIGMPSAVRYPDYLPMPTPPPTRFAAIGDAAAVPGLNEKGRAAYQQFLTRRVPRVFLIGPNGAFAAMDGGFDPLARGLAACAKAGIRCAPYAVDTQVVWTGGDPVYSRTVAAGRPTAINFAFSVNRDCSSRGMAKVTITRAPTHGTVLVEAKKANPSFPPGHPLAGCNVMPVQGVAVTYTPAPGFAGSDLLAIEETGVDGGRRVFQIALTVK